MNRILLKSILIGILGTSTTLGVTIPFLVKSSVTPIKKTRWVAGKTAKDYFELPSNSYVTGVNKWYEAIEASCKENNYEEGLKDFCEQLNGKEINEE